MIGWSTLGGIEHIRERRALALAANMFEVRLFDRLREEEGASYSPDAAHLAADAFPAWGIFYAAAEVTARERRRPSSGSPARSSPIWRRALPPPDEFARAQNPVISGIERRIATNSYWIEALENWEQRASVTSRMCAPI